MYFPSLSVIWIALCKFIEFVYVHDCVILEDPLSFFCNSIGLSALLSKFSTYREIGDDFGVLFWASSKRWAAVSPYTHFCERVTLFPQVMTICLLRSVCASWSAASEILVATRSASSDHPQILLDAVEIKLQRMRQPQRKHEKRVKTIYLQQQRP